MHATEPSNASRTLLYNIREGAWDAELLDILGIPTALLPEVKPSSGVFGKTVPALFEGVAIPIAGMAGDQMTYALEGSVFIAGAVIQWLRDELQIIETAAESETLATQVEDTGGVYLVPAFVGLGAPLMQQEKPP